MSPEYSYSDNNRDGQQVYIKDAAPTKLCHHKWHDFGERGIWCDYCHIRLEPKDATPAPKRARTDYELMQEWEAKYHDLLENRNSHINDLNFTIQSLKAQLQTVKKMYWEKVLADE